MKPLDVNLGHYTDIVELYHNESDRAAAILAGSFVEHHLAVFLKAFLIDDAEVDDLFQGFGPLSTFAQRISMAAAMGLIDKNIRDELRAIKEIRNHFAHHPLHASFADQMLDKHFNKMSVTHDPAFNAHGDGPLQDRKLVYLFSISCIVVRFHNAIARKRTAAPPVAERIAGHDDSANVMVDLSTYNSITDSNPRYE